MDSSSRIRDFNLNTVLLAGVLGLSGWTLYTISQQGMITAAQQVRLDSHDRELAAIELKITNANADLVLLKIELAEVKAEHK
jgi:hypothetical protein